MNTLVIILLIKNMYMYKKQNKIPWEILFGQAGLFPSLWKNLLCMDIFVLGL